MIEIIDHTEDYGLICVDIEYTNLFPEYSARVDDCSIRFYYNGETYREIPVTVTPESLEFNVNWAKDRLMEWAEDGNLPRSIWDYPSIRISSPNPAIKYVGDNWSALNQIDDVPTVIFDIDGTLADITHRVPLARAKKFDEFFEAMDGDVHNAPIVALHQMVQKQGYQIIYCTGRPDQYRKGTLAFLETVTATKPLLLMRPDKDRFIPDSEAKQDMLDGILTRMSKDNILFTVDDRQKVVDFWRANGITCLQCADGKF